MKKICTDQLYKGGIDVSEFRFPLYSLKKCFCLLINKLKTTLRMFLYFFKIINLFVLTKFIILRKQ